MNPWHIPIPARLCSDPDTVMSSCASPSLSAVAKHSPLSSSFTMSSQPSSTFLRPPSTRMRTLSIASVSSTTSEAIAARMRPLSIRDDDSATSEAIAARMRPLSIRDDDPTATFEPGTNIARPSTDGAPLVDHTGEAGFAEVAGDVDVYLAAEPNIDGKRPEELLWIVFWHVGAVATGVRVVRRAGGILCDERTDGEALVNIMGTTETIAGLKDVKPMHMCQHSLGKLSFDQRRALRDVAQRTPSREIPRSKGTMVKPRLLNHQEWMETVLQEAMEENILGHQKVIEAFSEILRYND